MFRIELDDWNDVSSKTILEGAIGAVKLVNETGFVIRATCKKRNFYANIYPYTTEFTERFPMFIGDSICFYLAKTQQYLTSVKLIDEFKRRIVISFI